MVEDDAAEVGSQKDDDSSSASVLALGLNNFREGLHHSRDHWKVLLLGQGVSVLVSTAWATQSTLFLTCSWSAPATSLSFAYFLLSLRLIPLALKARKLKRAKGEDTARGRWFLGLIPLSTTPWVYLGMAILNAEGNFCSFVAIRNTTITSISLFDSLSIPAAMILSAIFLRRKYVAFHLLGVCFCLIGIVMNVGIDIFGDRIAQKEQKPIPEPPSDEETYDDGSAEFPNKIIGDIFACLGGILLGTSDVMTELVVRKVGDAEYLGMLGFFGFFVSIIQAAILERTELVTFFNGDIIGDCGKGVVYALVVVFVASTAARTVGIATFLLQSEAALLNLSLLTSDLYAALFSILYQHILPRTLFWFAMLLVLAGIFVYEIGPSPVVQQIKHEDIQPPETNQLGSAESERVPMDAPATRKQS